MKTGLRYVKHVAFLGFRVYLMYQEDHCNIRCVVCRENYDLLKSGCLRGGCLLRIFNFRKNELRVNIWTYETLLSNRVLLRRQVNQKSIGLSLREKFWNQRKKLKKIGVKIADTESCSTAAVWPCSGHLAYRRVSSRVGRGPCSSLLTPFSTPFR